MKRAVFCIVHDAASAQTAVERLRCAGFAATDISVLLPDRSGSRDFAHEQHTKAPEGATTGGVAGGVLGGIAGWLVGIGTLAIPGLGPFVAAGPMLAALSGAAAGAAVGGLAGALVGMGVPEYEAKRYEGKLRHGNILISVHTDDGSQRERAKEIFESVDAEDIGTAGEEPVDESRRDKKERKERERTASRP